MMARKQFGIVVLLAVTILAVNAAAQSNQVAGIIGRTFIRDQSVSGTANQIHFGNGLTYEANYSHEFIGIGVASVSVEVPFVFTPTNKLQFNTNVVPKSFRSYFVTPAARLNLFPTTAFSPWISVGGGVGHFSPSSDLEFGGPNPSKSNTTGVFEIGGGLDVRVFGPVKIRGEIRDFRSGKPSLNLNTGDHYSNIFAGAGIVLSF
jgi:opacity protein-like surface antigen